MRGGGINKKEFEKERLLNAEFGAKVLSLSFGQNIDFGIAKRTQKS